MRQWLRYVVIANNAAQRGSEAEIVSPINGYGRQKEGRAGKRGGSTPQRAGRYA